jgi:hypothetical protein
LNGTLTHKEFLAETNGDPRIAVIERLIDDLEATGDIVIYNKALKVPVLRKLPEIFRSIKTE